MKKILIIFMALCSLAITAQNGTLEKKQQRKEMRENLTPEQRAELMSKKMTLNLNLTDAQQKKVKQLFLNMEKSKPEVSKDKKELNSEAKYDLKNSQMDRRITMKREFKAILSQEQFEKWEKTMNEKRVHSQKGAKRFKQEKNG